MSAAEAVRQEESAVLWRIIGLRKTFGGSRFSALGGASHTALDGVDLTVRASERIGIIGESGSGKTTLARVGLGLIPADSGTIELVGGAPTKRHRREVAQLLFQDPRAMLNPGLTIGTVLRQSARLFQPRRDPAEAVSEALARVGLAGRERARPHELSGGERRRAGLARVLLASPKVLVLDEPTAGLDAALKHDMMQLVQTSVSEETAVVTISHDLPLVLGTCDRVAVMYAGRIVQRFGSLAEARQDPHPHTASLLRAAGLL